VIYVITCSIKSILELAVYINGFLNLPTIRGCIMWRFEPYNTLAFEHCSGYEHDYVYKRHCLICNSVQVPTVPSFAHLTGQYNQGI
jgi:hypothetical protein